MNTAAARDPLIVFLTNGTEENAKLRTWEVVSFMFSKQDKGKYRANRVISLFSKLFRLKVLYYTHTKAKKEENTEDRERYSEKSSSEE